jgi:transcriptional regulator with XRE-family HTH domain
MSKPVQRAEPSDVVGARVREIRKRQGLTVDALAQRCAWSGLPHLTPNALYLIEGGGRGKSTKRSRRRVSVEELLGLSVALAVPPVALLLPEEAGAEFAVTPNVAAFAEVAFHWAIGIQALPADALPEQLVPNQLKVDPTALLPRFMRDRHGSANLRMAADLAQRAIADLVRAAANQNLIRRDVTDKAAELLQNGSPYRTEGEESDGRPDQEDHPEVR